MLQIQRRPRLEVILDAQFSLESRAKCTALENPDLVAVWHAQRQLKTRQMKQMSLKLACQTVNDVSAAANR